MAAPSEPSEQRRVVVGVDGSEPSLRALSWARFIAEGTGARIEAVGVGELPSTWAAGVVSAPLLDLNPGATTEAMLTNAATAAFGDDQPADLSLTAYVGSAAAVLLQVSEGATMLVVGSRGHGALAGIFLGSVSKTCIERAICPVLVVHDATPPPPRR